MNKIITKQEFDAILKLLAKYNVGVQEYQAVVNIWDKAKTDEKTNKEGEVKTE